MKMKPGLWMDQKTGNIKLIELLEDTGCEWDFRWLLTDNRIGNTFLIMRFKNPPAWALVDCVFLGEL